MNWSIDHNITVDNFTITLPYIQDYSIAVDEVEKVSALTQTAAFTDTGPVMAMSGLGVTALISALTPGLHAFPAFMAVFSASLGPLAAIVAPHAVGSC